LAEIKNETRTVILYEAPHHLKGTLDELKVLGEDRNIALCRELTKKYEEISRKTIGEAIEFYKENEPRGEYVLVIEGLDKEVLKEEEQKKWEEMTIEEHMEIYESKGFDNKEAMKMVAKDRGVSKRDIYNYLNKK
jgi:16S rRNA (cytidine1402-2'-O)-methyltransferase